MSFARRTKLSVVVAVLVSSSLALGATKPEKHPAPHHKAHKAAHHASTHETPQHATTHHATTHRASKKSRKHTRGQQAIDSERARQIQEALVREHYLNGEPSGSWDTATQAAMRRYQAEQGWQTKEVPDSRALIRLGLGPDHVHLLNPESAMTTEAAAVRPTSTVRVSTAPTNVPEQNSAPVSAPVSTTGSPQ